MTEKGKTPTQFILALRKYRERKRLWQAEMDTKLAAIEERLKRDEKFLYHDML